MTPGRATPITGLSGAELVAAVVRAAQAYDYANRPRGRDWAAVPPDQVARIVTGALESLEFDDSQRALLDIIAAVDHLDEPGPEADHIRLLAEYGLGEAAHPDGDLPGIVPSDSTDAEERM
jgi:hypothetical protein